MNNILGYPTSSGDVQANWGGFNICQSAVPEEALTIDPKLLLKSSPLNTEYDSFPPAIPSPVTNLQDEASTPGPGSLAPENRSALLVSLESNVPTDPVHGAPSEEAVLCRAGTEFLLGGMVPKKGRRRRKMDGDEDQEDEAVLMQTPQSMNPQDYYGMPQKRPKPWGWRKGATGKCLFTYNELGEFEYGKLFSRTELEVYLYAQAPQRSSSYRYSHAQDLWVERQLLPGEKCVRGKHRHGLTLWIGWAPAQLNDRFPSPESHKCRFKGCPARDGKFRGGQPRVTFDERMNVDGSRDPYHVAGYMHLFCLEQQFDILKLIADLDVRLDTRYFAREEAGNPASFHSRQNAHRQIKAAHSWLAREWQRFLAWDEYISTVRSESKMYGRRLTREQTARPRHFDDSLTKNMVETDVENYSTAGKECRKARSREAMEQGKTIIDAGAHFGNLEFIREQLDIRNNRAHSMKSLRGRSKRAEDPTLGHRVYDLDHFIEGFQPGRRGPSSLDALGWTREPHRATPYAQNEILSLSYDHNSQPSFLFSPTYKQSSEMLSWMPSMNEQVQLPHPSPMLSGISTVAPFISPDHVSDNLHWIAQTDFTTAALCGDANQSLDPITAVIPSIANREDLEDFQFTFLAPEGPALDLRHDAGPSNQANSLESIPCETESTPITYVNRGESPIDEQFNAKTNKRSHGEMITQHQYAEFTDLFASDPETVDDGPSLCKRARIDSLMLDEVIRGYNPEATTDEAVEGGIAGSINLDFGFDFSLHGTGPNDAASVINDEFLGKFTDTTSQWLNQQVHSTDTISRYENVQPHSPYGEFSAQDQKPSEAYASTPVQNFDLNFDEFLHGDWNKGEDASSLFVDDCLPSVSSSVWEQTGSAIEQCLNYNVEPPPIPDDMSLGSYPLSDVAFPSSTPGEPGGIATAEDYEGANVQ